MTQFSFCPLCGKELVSKEIDGRDRLACTAESCAYVYWDNPVPVVTAMIEHDGAVLLARNNAWPEKVFGLITGFLEKNETPETGIVREVKEEVGLDAEIDSFMGLYSLFEANQLLIAYCIKTSGEIKLGEELAEYKLIPPEKLRPWNFGTGLIVKDWLDKFNRA
ncbi:MAG: NUDIX domain-containing protein [bacterium]|nr:NUDIX domain-containing protein [bacterium]